MRNLLQFIERHCVIAAVVEFRGAGGFVPGHLLRRFEFPAVLQIDGDARRPEAVAQKFCPNADSRSPATDHSVDFGLRHRLRAGGGNDLTKRRPNLGYTGTLGSDFL